MTTTPTDISAAIDAALGEMLADYEDWRAHARRQRALLQIAEERRLRAIRAVGDYLVSQGVLFGRGRKANVR